MYCNKDILASDNPSCSCFRYAILVGTTTDYESLQDQILLGYKYKVRSHFTWDKSVLEQDLQFCFYKENREITRFFLFINTVCPISKLCGDTQFIALNCSLVSKMTFWVQDIFHCLIIVSDLSERMTPDCNTPNSAIVEFFTSEPLSWFPQNIYLRCYLFSSLNPLNSRSVLDHALILLQSLADP